MNPILLFAIYFFLLFSALYWLVEGEEEERKGEKWLSITIAIPARNEEENIERAILSCLQQRYKGKLEIIVINDASTDKTKEICENYAKKGLIKLINNKRCMGKVWGINKALKLAKGELFCVLDGDSELLPKALEEMVPHFEDPKVGAVIPKLLPSNTESLLGKLQLIEYEMASFLKSIMAAEGALFMCHGAGSIYRTSALRELGGFDELNQTEDFEMSLRLIKHGYKIKSSRHYVARTKVPSDLRQWIRQRMRWSIGYLDNLWKHGALFNPKFGLVGLYFIPLTLASISLALFCISNFLHGAINRIAMIIRDIQLVGLSLPKLPALDPFSFGTAHILSIICTALGILLYLKSRSEVSKLIHLPLLFLYWLPYNWLWCALWPIAAIKALRGEGRKRWKR